MTILAANATETTLQFIKQIFRDSPKFVKLGKQIGLNINDNTILLRLAIIHLEKNPPTSIEVSQYKAALLKPDLFDQYLKELLTDEEPIVQ